MTIDRIGLSGIQAADISLHNTAHNIANSETPWFTRLQPVLVADPGQGADYLRQPGGVSVRQLLRLSSEFLNNEVFHASASQASADTFANTMSTIDKLLSSEHTGMNGAITDFIGDLQRADARPESLPLREQWLGTAKRLVSQLNSLDRQFRTFFVHRAELMDSVVKESNRLSESITRLNREIVELAGSQVDQQNRTSDLEDQRDLLIDQLATLVGIDVLKNDNNSVTLSIRTPRGNLPLVMGFQNWQLDLQQTPGDIFMPEVHLKAAGVDMPVIADEGKLAGLQQLGHQGLLPVLNHLGWQSVLLAGSLNQQLAAGDDLQGNSGSPLFSNINSHAALSRRAVPENVTGTGQLTVEINQLPELIPSDYQLEFTTAAPEGNLYQLTRLSDGQKVTGNIKTGEALFIDGLKIHLKGTANANDRYLVTPWRFESRNLEVILDNPKNLGFAGRGAGPGDNRNLAELLDWLNGKDEYSTNIQENYIRLQSTVANQTASANQLQKTAEAIHHSAMKERESLSGVNMDDEATNLIRLHQFYQANARLLQVNRVIIDDLLSMFY